MGACSRLDVGDRVLALCAAASAARVELLEHLAGQLRRQRPARQRAVGDHADQRALERAHVVVNTLRDHAQGVLVGKLDAIVLDTLAQDRQPGGELRRGNVCDQARLKALAQAVLERL